MKVKCGYCNGTGVDHYNDNNPCDICEWYGVIPSYRCNFCGDDFIEDECDQVHVVFVHDKDRVKSVSEYDDICCPQCGRLFDLEDKLQELLGGGD